MATGPEPRRFRRRLLCFAASCVILVGLFIMLFVTAPGLWLCGRTASALVSAFTPFSLHVSGISGIFPFRLKISRIELLDRGGVWLTLDEISLDANLQTLIKGQMRLSSLTSAEVQWARSPIREKRWRIPKIAGLRHYPAVDAVSVGRLLLGRAVLGRPVVMTINGSIERMGGGGGERVVFSGKRTDGTVGTIDLSYKQGKDAPSFEVHLNDSEILPLWLGLDSSVVLDLAGNGPRTEWRGTLRATTHSESILDGKLQCSGEFPTAISGSLDANLAPSRRLQVLERFLGPDAHVSFDALLSKTGQLDILDLDAWSPRGMIQGAGSALLPERQYNLALQANHADLSLLTCREEGTGPYLPAEICASVSGDSSKIKVDLVSTCCFAPLFYAETTIIPGPKVRIDGTANVFTAPFTDSDTARGMFGELSAIAWSAQYDAPGRLSLGSLAVDNQAVQIAASGSVVFPSTSATIGYTGTLHTGCIPVLAEHIQSDGRIPFTGEIGDSLRNPTVLFTAKGINSVGNGLFLKDGTLNLGFHLDETEMGKRVRNGLARIESPNCGYQGKEGMAITCAAPFESDDFDSVLFNNIELAVPAFGGRLTAYADYIRSDGKADVHGHVAVDDLASTSALYPHPLGGSVSGEFHVQKNKGREPLRLSVECDWQHPSGLPEGLGRAAGNTVHASLRMESDNDRIRVEDAGIDLEAGRITACGWQNRADRRFKFDVDSKGVNLAKVATAQSVKGIGGFLDISTRMEGVPDDFSVAGDATVKGLSWDQLAVRSTKLKFKGEHLPRSPEGALTLSLSNGKKGPTLDGNLGFRYKERLLHVEKATFTSSKNRVEGGLDYQTDSGEFSANADFSLSALNDLSSLLSVDLSGRAQGKVAASRKGERLDITLRGQAEKLGTPWGSIGVLDADGAVNDILRKPQGNAKISAVDVGGRGLQFGKADISVSGDGSSVLAKAAMSGRYQKNDTWEPLPFQVKTSVSASFQTQDLIVTEATGQLANFEFALAGPAHIHRSGTGYTLDNTAFHAGGGGGDLAINTSSTGIHALSTWKDIPLSAATLAGLGGMEGTLNGSLAIDGTLQAPTCRLEMLLAKVRKGAYRQGPGLDASIKAVCDGQWTSAEITMTLSDAAKATLSGRIPVNLSLSPAGVAVRAQDALQADADVSADLAAAVVLMNRTNDLPQGTVTGKFRMGGTVDAPELSGELNLKNGGYENLAYGAVLKGLQVRLIADGNRVRIDEFSGTDGENGRVSATGQMELSFAKKHPFHADMTLDRMHSFSTEYGTAVLSGKIQFAGTMSDAALNGTVAVESGDFRMPERMNSSRASKVEFTDKNAPVRPALSGEDGAAMLPAISLDVSVSVPGRVSLRAPVLETEWNGDMRFRGTLKEPRVEGNLRVRRGYLDLIGQRFSLADSTVGFLDGAFRTPYLNVTGVCMANDITARLQVSGPPSDAQLTLSSDPPMPQDEILSKLLFRKGVSQASPLQAIQIARAASMFSDRLSLGQFLTGSVKLPGVDLFDIRTGEKVDKTVVGVGKYINDKIYVEAEQGAAADSGRVSAQVEVTPRVSVKADVGARNRGGVGILWKKDY